MPLPTTGNVINDVRSWSWILVAVVVVVCATVIGSALRDHWKRRREQ